MNDLIKRIGKASIPTAIITFFAKHKNIIIPTSAIISSWGATLLAVRNSMSIIETIKDARDILSHEEDKEVRKKIYIDILKELTPKLLPILFLQGISTSLIVMMKKEGDKKDKQIAELTAALGLAQNAVAQYQMWEKEAKKELSEEKVKEIESKITKEHANDQSIKQINDIPASNNAYLYIDPYYNRKFYSMKSPVEIENFCKDASYDLFDGNLDGDKFTVNDIYFFIGGSKLEVQGGEHIGWTTRDCRGQRKSDTVFIELWPAELDDHKTLCWEIHYSARELGGPFL